MEKLFANVYRGCTVLVTGHTGFKGSWLAAWLHELGANVVGYSLPTPPTAPSNYEISGIGGQIVDCRGDVRDLHSLVQTITTYQPEIVFHLAAQPIVLRSVQDPHNTFTTNSQGTLNILEAIRQTDTVRSLVCITTDKVYENQEWLWGYRENDRLGGYDPYSASKAMAELAISCYRETYFPARKYSDHGLAIASTRAGNVIGGGDFADYRLVPDCMRALMSGEPIGVRNPTSVRPWQHVLEPLSGYLWLGAKLLRQGIAFGEAWNFGPSEQPGISTGDIADKLINLWGSGSWVQIEPDYAPVETGLLRLSWDKAAARLGWRPVYTWEEALAEIAAWFKAYQAGRPIRPVLVQHIDNYVQRAKALDLAWTASTQA